MKHGDTMKFTAIGQCSVFTKVAIVASCKAIGHFTPCNSIFSKRPYGLAPMPHLAL